MHFSPLIKPYYSSQILLHFFWGFSQTSTSSSQSMFKNESFCNLFNLLFTIISTFTFITGKKYGILLVIRHKCALQRHSKQIYHIQYSPMARIIVFGFSTFGTIYYKWVSHFTKVIIKQFYAS